MSTINEHVIGTMRKVATTVAALALAVTGLVGTAPQAEAAPGWSVRKQVTITARAQVGDAYRSGAAGPSAFDCSGLVQYSFKKAGKSIPRTTSGIRYSSKFRVVKTVRNDWNTNNVAKYAYKGDILYRPGHVGIYVGDGKMVDAGNPRVDVIKRRPYSGTWTILRWRA